jgi:predicted alpha/beta-hydrolase family hydrolase
VFKLFLEVLGAFPANWKINRTQLQAAENLFTERGLDKVRNALEYYKENKDDKYCPQISQPSDLDAKYVKLSQFKNKHES